jgi:hypothetical protein
MEGVTLQPAVKVVSKIGAASQIGATSRIALKFRQRHGQLPGRPARPCGWGCVWGFVCLAMAVVGMAVVGMAVAAIPAACGAAMVANRAGAHKKSLVHGRDGAWDKGGGCACLGRMI